MTIELTAILGFQFSIEDALYPFRKETRVVQEEKSYMKDRWNPDTGAKLAPFKVIIQSAIDRVDVTYFHEGMEIAGHRYNEIARDLSTIFECLVVPCYESRTVIFSPTVTLTSSTFETERFDYNNEETEVSTPRELAEPADYETLRLNLETFYSKVPPLNVHVAKTE